MPLCPTYKEALRALATEGDFAFEPGQSHNPRYFGACILVARLYRMSLAEVHLDVIAWPSGRRA